MGQKVHPIGFRLGIIKTWNSRWYSDKNFGGLLHEDLKIKKFVKDRLLQAGVSNIEIERAANKLRVNITAARPGIIIGKKGSEIEKLKSQLADVAREYGFRVSFAEIRNNPNAKRNVCIYVGRDIRVQENCLTANPTGRRGF